METAGTQGKSGSEAAFGAALEGFGHLLRAFLSESPTAAGASVNVQSVARRLAVEFDRWLRDPASTLPWWNKLQTAPSFMQSRSQSARLFDLESALQPGAALAPIAQSGFVQSAQRVAGLMTRCSQLQGQLAMHWNTIVRRASERFIAGVASSAAASDLTTVRKLYDLWIECAEQAYAAEVHTDEFCRTQAELVNTTTLLLLEQRQQVECFAPVLGLATRSEVDALRSEMRRMRSETRPGSSTSQARRRKGQTS